MSEVERLARVIYGTRYGSEWEHAPSTIKDNYYAITDRIFAEGYVRKDAIHVDCILLDGMKRKCDFCNRVPAREDATSGGCSRCRDLYMYNMAIDDLAAAKDEIITFKEEN